MTFGTFQGQLRPLVEAAWKNHAGLIGVSVSDKSDRDAWYRDHLYVACRLTSSKDASDRQRQDLLSYFASLSGMPVTLRPAPRAAATPAPTLDVPHIRRWTAYQAKCFWTLAEAARHAAQQRDNASGPDPLVPWTLKRLSEALNRPVQKNDGSLQLGTTTDGFDTAMSVLAIIAEDLYWINRTSAASERRLRWQMARFLEDLSWLEGAPVGWDYVKGIYGQANSKLHLPKTPEDCPAQLLFSILQSLDTHIRRICYRLELRPCWLPTRPPANPCELKTWRWYHAPVPGQTRAPNGKPFVDQQKGVA